MHFGGEAVLLLDINSLFAKWQDEAWLSCPKAAGTLLSEYETERKPEVLSPLEMRPSSIAPNPEVSQPEKYI